MEMHDVIAIRDFGEVERLVLAAQAHQPFLLPQRAQGLVAPENLGVAQDDQFSRRPDEAAQERAACRKVIDSTGIRASARISWSRFCSPSLLQKIATSQPSAEPVAQVIEKKIAAIFLEDEVAARRVQKIVGEEVQL